MEKELSITINSVMKNTFMLMSMALVLTGFISYFIICSETLFTNLILNRPLFWVICILEILLVIILTKFVNELSFNVSLTMFTIYTVMNGITLSPIIYLYTKESVVSTFFITAATFSTMAIIGYTTKKDLTSIGNILYMALIGIIIASVVNLFMNNSTMAMIINYVGVLIFVGLTAFDTQKIKNVAEECYNKGESGIIPKLSILGALTLYLDFINMFIKLLQLMGKRK